MTVDEMNAKYGKPEVSMKDTPPVDTSGLENAWAEYDKQNKPSFISRVGSDISGAGEEINKAISGEGKYAGESSIRRGFEAAASGLETPLKVVSEALPGIARMGLEKVGGLYGGVINWLGDKIGSTQIAQDFVSKHPEAAKYLEETAGVGKASGDIANTILAEAGGAKALQKGVDISNSLIEKTKNIASGITEDIANGLEKQNLRLTPVQKSNLGQKLNDIVDFNTENKITGSPEVRYGKIVNITNEMENTYQDFLTNGEAKDITIPKTEIIKDLEKLKNEYANSDMYDLTQAENQVDSAINRIKKYGEDIPAKNVNNLKRSVFDSAYNEAGNKVLNEVEHDIGGVLKNKLEQATDGMEIDGKSMNDFNKNYGTALQAKKLLKIAQGRPELGLVGKMTSKAVGGIIGEAVGGPIGAGTGALFGDKVAQLLIGTSMRSKIASFLKGITSD